MSHLRRERGSTLLDSIKFTFSFIFSVYQEQATMMSWIKATEYATIASDVVLEELF